ncbi:MAG: L,D-transpeptidase [Anaerolineae bacterium]
MRLNPFNVSRSRRARTRPIVINLLQDGVLVAVACFFMLGLGGMAIRLTYPQQAQATTSAISRFTVVNQVSSTKTLLHTPSPVAVVPATAAPSPSPSVTPSVIPDKVATATPSWVTERYLPLPVSEKWIEVDITKQELRAYDGERLVFSTTISSGRGVTQAFLGKYRITQKLATKLLTGPGYYLPDVPWVMVINSNLLLHGAYWQDSWGAPSNYGFINLKPTDARWLYDWSLPSVPVGQQSVQATAQDRGTWVIIHQ